MKKIIEGKRYDTETAKLVASYENQYGRNDFNFYKGELYRTTKGNFFIVEESWCSSLCRRLSKFSLEEAKEWVEARANSKYEDLFPFVEA
jgi:hypothetical protein